MKKIFVVAGIFITTFVCGVQTVSASSIYDNVYDTVSSVQVHYPDEPDCTNIDITTNWPEYILDESHWANPSDANNPYSSMSLRRESFIAAINDDQYGTWAVSQVYPNGTGSKEVLVTWSQVPDEYIQWQTYAAILKPYTESVTIICSGYDYGEFTPLTSSPSINYQGLSIAQPGGGSTNVIKNLFVYSSDSGFDLNYPYSYEGVSVNTQDDTTDTDGDGLLMVDELAQGTSDFEADTDSDGLNDYIESTQFVDRDDVFCGTSQCVYPDPTVKDLYVEVDWLKDASNVVYKPSSTELELVEDMFADKNVNLHFDTGQYGGGEEISVSSASLFYTQLTGVADYLDYREGTESLLLRKFSEDREQIWKYLVSGYNYPEAPDSSGWAEDMSDILYISYGLIQASSEIDAQDKHRATANTIAHELAHSICLSKERTWEEQPEECIYTGIDNNDEQSLDYNLENYVSVMNYRYQLIIHDDMGVVDLSDGANGTGDHDDWSAVLLAMSKFNGSHTDISAGANTNSGATLATTTRERKINEEAPIQDEELQKAADEYEKSHKPNTIENVMEQDEELRKAIEDGEGENVSAKNQTSTSEVAESNTSTDPANSNTLLIAGLAAAGVVTAGIATLLVIKRRK